MKIETKAIALGAMGLAIVLGAIGPGRGMGHGVASAIEATARQPEAEGKVRTLMFIGLAFLEALALYALVIAFIIMAQIG